MWYHGEEFGPTILVKCSLSSFRQLLNHLVLNIPVCVSSTEPCAEEQPGRQWVRQWNTGHRLGCTSLLLCMAVLFLLCFHCSHSFHSNRHLMVGLCPQEGGSRAAALLTMSSSWTGPEERDASSDRLGSLIICFRFQASYECLKQSSFPAGIFYPTVCMSAIWFLILPVPWTDGFIDLTVQMDICRPKVLTKASHKHTVGVFAI